MSCTVNPLTSTGFTCVSDCHPATDAPSERTVPPTATLSIHQPSPFVFVSVTYRNERSTVCPAYGARLNDVLFQPPSPLKPGQLPSRFASAPGSYAEHGVVSAFTRLVHVL